MTLDEWKALQAANRVKPEYNIRKPGEGCSNDPQWKKMVALTRKNPKEQSEDDEEEEVNVSTSVFVFSQYVFLPFYHRHSSRADGGYRSDLRKSYKHNPA